MSGVFPGTRTMVFQRVRLGRREQKPCEPAVAAASLVAEEQMQWARLLWYDEPPACVVELPGVALRLAEPLDVQSGEFGQRLSAALDGEGWQMRACGN
jgi:hypothetical protein